MSVENKGGKHPQMVFTVHEIRKGTKDEGVRAVIDWGEIDISRPETMPIKKASEERLQSLAKKEFLNLADWIEITGFGIGNDEQIRYNISADGVRFIGWPSDLIESSPPLEQAMMLQQNEEPGLMFPCTPRQLVDFVDSEAGSMFGSLFVPDSFRDAVSIAQAEGGANNYQPHEPRLIHRNDVIGKFRVRADPDENLKFWDGKLSRPPAWLKPALGELGKPGESTLWKPLVIAHCLLGGHKSHKKPFMTLQQLDSVIRKEFPDWFESWKDETQDKR